MNTAREFTENLVALPGREHDALAEFLVALAEFDRRRAWVELGHSSLFYFLRRELRLSSAAAQYRKVAAELIQRVPGVIEPLRRGQLCLTSIIEAARVVTAENWETLLPRFYGLSRREAMDVVAELQPHPAPPLRTVVTPIRAASIPRRDAPAPALVLQAAGEPRVTSDSLISGSVVDATSAKGTFSTATSPDDTSLSVTSPGEVRITAISGVGTAPVPPMTAPGRLEVEPISVEPLTGELSRLHVTVSKGFLRKLQEVGDALSHAMPGATEAELLEAGLDLLLAQSAKRRGLVQKPRKNPRPSNGDHIPAHVRREVWKRDGGRCQYPLASGGICGSTRRLEFDHIRPRSLGGPSTVENVRVACRPHNDLAARLALGDETMDPFTRGLRAARARAGLRSNMGEPVEAPSLD